MIFGKKKRKTDKLKKRIGVSTAAVMHQYNMVVVPASVVSSLIGMPRSFDFKFTIYDDSGSGSGSGGSN